jgi:hypothetical protein
MSLEQAAKEFEYSGSLFVILKDRLRKTKGFNTFRDILNDQDIVGAMRLEELFVNTPNKIPN